MLLKIYEKNYKQIHLFKIYSVLLKYYINLTKPDSADSTNRYVNGLFFQFTPINALKILTKPTISTEKIQLITFKVQKL